MSAMKTKIRSKWHGDLGRVAVSGLMVRDRFLEKGTFELKRLRKTVLAAGEGAGLW